MARNLQALLPLVEEYGPSRIAFCTDDRDPEDIADNGHINGMVREAVAAGIAAEDALLMASLHPAPWHRLDASARSPRATRPTCWCSPISSGSSRTSCSSGAARSRSCRATPCPTGCARRSASGRSRPRLRDPVERRADTRDRPGHGSGRDRVDRPRPRAASTARRSPTPAATSRRSPSSSATSRPAGSGSASSPAPGCSAARSHRASPTTPTTSSSSA